MAITVSAASGISAASFADVGDTEFLLQGLQYQFAREMTRLVATRASQVQGIFGAAAPVFALANALADATLPYAGEDLTPDLVNASSDADLQALDDWFARNGGCLGSTESERAHWQALLSAAGYSFPVQTPVISDRTDTYTVDGQSSTEHSITLDWYTADQLPAVTANLTRDESQGTDNGTALFTSDPGVHVLPRGVILTQQLSVHVLDRDAGLHLEWSEWDALDDDLSSRLSTALASLEDNANQLGVQGIALRQLMDHGERMVKEARKQRESELDGLVDLDKVLAEYAQVREEQKARQDARPWNAAEGRPMVPGSLRSTSFPTQAPPFDPLQQE